MSEYLALLTGKKKEDNGSLRRRSFGSFSRFGPDVETPGIKPSGDSISNIPAVLEGHRPSMSAQADAAENTLSPHHKRGSSGQLGRSRSFVQNLDGTMVSMTPVEMGRHELYEEVPFLAMSGLQKKEHNLSVAFSSYAAQLDALETDEYMAATTGKPLNREEKERRLSQMSLLLLDELEVDAITVTTPLIFAVLIASMLMFNMGYNISVMNAPEPFVFPGHSTSSWSMAVAAFCIG